MNSVHPGAIGLTEPKASGLGFPLTCKMSGEETRSIFEAEDNEMMIGMLEISKDIQEKVERTALVMFV